MPNTNPWISAAERCCLAVLLVWLAALPLPFGSMIERARLPLIVFPISVCVIATLLRLYAIRDRTNASRPTRPWVIWAIGTGAFLAAGAMQLMPLPPSILRVVSPESNVIWSGASRVASLAGVKVSALHPISVDPLATRFEIFRIAALLATFTAFALLARTPPRRLALALVVCAAATFEAAYGIRQAALQRYEIWGWTNGLIFNRVSGTFVNPNHFAHYTAIAVPMALYLAAAAWYRSGTSRTPLRQRLVVLVERQLLWMIFAILAAVLCVTAILLAQSRGAMFSLAGGVLIVASFLPGKRMARLAFGAVAGLLVVLALAFFLGPERTIARFIPVAGESRSLAGRRVGIEAAVRLWERFPVLGSGLGTFDRVVLLEQREGLDKFYQHAHNDYAELAATSGTLGYLIAVVTLFGGYVALLKMTFGRDAAELSWLRRAFQAAALTSLTIAMVHALVDFNFFIPANPATLAAIVGAAVSVTDYDKRTRR
jgi:O-antigen ligase